MNSPEPYDPSNFKFRMDLISTELSRRVVSASGRTSQASPGTSV